MTDKTEASKESIRMTAHKLACALEFAAPDYATDPDQGETEVQLAYVPEQLVNGEKIEAGLRVWLLEYPEEGSILLSSEDRPTSTAFASGAKTMFDALIAKTVNNWHTDPTIQQTCAAENALIKKCALEALESVSLNSYDTWISLEKACSRIAQLEYVCAKMERTLKELNLESEICNGLDFGELIDLYWDAAYQQGVENGARNPKADTQKKARAARVAAINKCTLEISRLRNEMKKLNEGKNHEDIDIY